MAVGGTNVKHGRDRQQLLLAVLLGIMQVEDVRLIVHGLSGKAVRKAHLGDQEQIVVGNGPLLPNSTIILTECHVQDAAALAARFLSDDARLRENLELLDRGEGIAVDGRDIVLTTWRG